MWATETIERIREYSNLCKKQLPTIDEINTFKKISLSYHSEYLETVKNEEGFEKDVENMKNISLFELNLESSSLKKKNDLVKHKEKILELSSKVNELNRNYEKLCKEKTELEEKLNSFQVDKDVILAFKIATMAHFSYGEKIKYGYLLDKKTLATRTFPHDPDKKASQEEIQKKWDLLKSFAANSAKRTD